MEAQKRSRRARARHRGLTAVVAAAIGAVLTLGVAPAAIATAPGAGAATTPPPGSEGLVVDAWGGLHIVSYAATPTIKNFNHASYWPGWDIVRGVALRAADPMTCASFGGYTLDAWGGLHPFGINGKAGPSRPKDGPYWRGWDIARDVALVPTDPRNPDSPPAGGYVLDSLGVHAKVPVVERRAGPDGSRKGRWVQTEHVVAMTGIVKWCLLCEPREGGGIHRATS